MSLPIAIVVGAIIGTLGLGGAIALVLLVNPDKVQIWASYLWKAVRFITKRAEYAYVASDVSAQINSHLMNRVYPELLGGISSKRIAVKWDNSSDAIAHEVEGTLVIRLRRHEDRILNILNTYYVAAPKIFVPEIRSQLDRSQSNAIDLQLCRRLAESISQSALVTYRTSILDPAIEEDERLKEVLDHLKSLDLGGLFIPIFLQELIKLGAANVADHMPYLAAEVSDFIRFLKTVAERSRREITELSFIGKYIKLNTLLVAHPDTQRLGVGPYRSRVSREISKGVNTVYLMASGDNIPFALEVAEALDGDRRLLRQENRSVYFYRDGVLTKGVVIPFERNLGFSSQVVLDAEVKDGKYSVGSCHNATVTDVQSSYVMVDIDNAHQGYIPIHEVSWKFVTDCNTEVKIGDEIEVAILEVKPDELEMIVSRRQCLPDPLHEIDVEGLKNTKQIMIPTLYAGHTEGHRFLAGYLKEMPDVPSVVYEQELEWGAPLHGVNHVPLYEEFEVLIYDFNLDTRRALCSRKRLSADKWNIIRKRYPRSHKMEARVSAVLTTGAWCEIEPGLAGFVPEDEFLRAGLEYKNFESDLHEGQVLYVYVSRVVSGGKQRINLGLQRNLS